MAASIWRHRGLARALVKREVVGRYRGSVMGIAWSFFNPLLMLAIYTVVFSTIFKARWGTGDDSKVNFAILLFVGMIVHGLFAECVNRAPSLILSNVNFVKKVVFPLEILPWVAFGSALFHATITTQCPISGTRPKMSVLRPSSMMKVRGFSSIHRRRPGGTALVG